MSTTRVEAAGGVVLRGAVGSTEVLVVHRPRYDDWSLPKGKLDKGETGKQAALREVLEETGRTFVPEAVTGVYLWTHPSGDTYLRVAFCGTVGDRRPGSILDTGIVDARWLTLDEIAALAAKHRSPLVMRCIDDYRAGARHSLELLQRLLPDGSRA